MAGLHTGIFGEKYKCSICKVNPKMKVAWGCEKKAAMSESARSEMDGNTIYVYEQCLLKFIPRSIYSFMEVYDYHCKFTSAQMPSFTELSPRFYFAYNYYENKVNQFKQELAKHG